MAFLRWLAIQASLLLALCPPAFAAETVTIETLQNHASSYHLKVVTLHGIVHQIQILADPPVALPQLDFQCRMVHPAYTFVLADETGFQQVTVRARPPCVSQQSPAEPPDVADGDTVTIDAQITVTNGNTANALAVGIRRN